MTREDKRAFDRARNRALVNYISHLIKSGHGYHEIAIDLAISVDQLTQFINLSNEQLLADKVLTINRLKRKGYTNATIAKVLGLTESAIKKLLVEDQLNKSPEGNNDKQAC